MRQDLGCFDLIVVGGGVNGAGIARDAAGRGLKVLLCQKDDLAQGASSGLASLFTADCAISNVTNSASSARR